MIALELTGIAVCGPGLPDWETARDLLRRGQEPPAQDLPRLAAPALPVNERRRVTDLIRLALTVATAASGATGVAGRAVFASSTGDSAITHRLCSAFTRADRPVSPTQFHNSVHNAPAGYWSIALGSALPTTSLAAGEATFAAGLLESAAQVLADGEAVLLVCYDLPAPPPLTPRIPVERPFATAMLLGPPGGGQAPCLELRPGADAAAATPMPGPSLEALRLANPAARSLPLLAALARGGTGRLALPYLDGASLTIEVRA